LPDRGPRNDNGGSLSESAAGPSAGAGRRLKTKSHTDDLGTSAWACLMPEPMNETLVKLILLLILGNIVAWLVFTALLWVMIKIQKLNYNALGLFASSAAATLTSLIPVVGPYLGYVVLVLCLWKCTGANIIPDITFTAVIASALMFCINLFVIGTLMGNLRPDLSKLHGIKPVHATERRAASSSNAPAPPSPPSRGEYKTSVRQNEFSLKGISLGTSQKLAMVRYGAQIFTLSEGETCVVKTPDGPVSLRCDKIETSSVHLILNDEEQLELHLN
jgi:hypothetical protein